MNGGVSGKARCAMRNRQIEIAIGLLSSICRIAKAHFLGESVAVKPINQPFAPARNNCCLRIVHMGIHKSRNKKLITIIDALIRSGGRQNQIGGTDIYYFFVPNPYGSTRFIVNRLFKLTMERIFFQGQQLTNQYGFLLFRHDDFPEIFAFWITYWGNMMT